MPEQLIFWQSDKSEIFEEKFDILMVSEIEVKLDNLIETDCITENSINEIVGDIDSLFESCSKASFGTKTVKKHNKYSNFKPWFNRGCINARNAYHKIRKLYNRYKTEYHKNNLKRISKHYKNTMSKNYKQFKMELIEKLRRLKTNDPKQYWKIINTEKKTGRTNAPLNDLYSFYKAASEYDDDDDDNNHNDDDVQNAHANKRFAMLNEELNVSITSEEILQATKALKNNKSPGLDNIPNEHLKSTITVMSPLYVKLFYGATY